MLLPLILSKERDTQLHLKCRGDSHSAGGDEGFGGNTESGLEFLKKKNVGNEINPVRTRE